MAKVSNVGWGDHAALCLAAVGMGFISLFCWNPWEPASPESFFELSEPVVDLGRLASTSQGSSQFELTNVSNQKFRVRATNDCSCTHIDPKECTIPPNSSAIFKLTYSPKGIGAGPIISETTQLDLNFEVGERMFSFPLPVKASVIKPFTYDPNSLVVDATALEANTYSLELALCTGVESVEFLQLPEFLRRQSVDFLSDFRVVKLNAVVLPNTVAERTQSTLSIRAFYKDVTEARPVDVDLPITLVLEKPYRFTGVPLSLDASQVGSAELSLQAGKHILGCRILKASTTHEAVSAKTENDKRRVTLRLVGGDRKEILNEMCYLKLLVGVTSRGKEELFKDLVPVHIVSQKPKSEIGEDHEE